MNGNDDLMRSIDAKLGAILTLTLDGYLRQTGVARPKERSVDKMLSDAGLSASAIGDLLGKTERAVHMQLAEAKKKTASRRKSSKAGS